MRIASVTEAQGQLARLIEAAAAGEEVLITGERDTLLARIVPVEQAGAPRRPGSMRGQFTVPGDFTKPLSEDELREWE